MVSKDIHRPTERKGRKDKEGREERKHVCMLITWTCKERTLLAPAATSTWIVNAGKKNTLKFPIELLASRSHFVIYTIYMYYKIYIS